MKVWITGATGFVGLNIVHALCEAGHEPVCYVRPGSATDHLDRFAVAVVRGELTDLARARAAMAGCEAVIHCAGNTSTYPWDLALLEQVNHQGTRTQIEAALANGIGRFVYTSTSSTIGALNDPDQRANEDQPLLGFRARNPYGLSKAAAERALLAAIPRGLEPIILNPCEVLGRFDHTLQWGRMVLAVCGDRVPFIPPGSGSFCAASAVGAAHVAALTRGRVGSRYLLAGADTSYAELLARIATVCGVAFSDPGLDYQQCLYEALEHQHTYHLTAIAPMVDAYRMRVFKGHYLFDDRRAQRDLGYHGGDLDDMIGEAAHWYRDHGFLPAPAPALAAAL